MNAAWITLFPSAPLRYDGRNVRWIPLTVAAALTLVARDFWEEGLEVTAIGSVEGQQPKAIEDRGLEFILREFAAGKSVELVYTARCRESGEWTNAAAAGAANADPVQASLTGARP